MTKTTRVLSDAERMDWLRLIRSENVGPVTFAQLIDRFGTAGEALRALPDLARRGGRTRPLVIAGRAEAEAEWARAAQAGARLIASVEPDYPQLLAEIDGPPPLIAMIGHAHLLARRTVALVGARNASVAGMTLAGRIAEDLGRAGVTIVSGLARGIDAAAHRAALATGTAAVMAGGVDIIYPPEHEALHRQIAAEGVLVSEMPMGEEPQGRHFPRRNRIVSGLSLGVVVIEAATGSGSLITARFALDQGREVFAVPGSPLDPRSAGANGLLREGAILTEGAGDVLRGLAADRPQPSAHAPSARPPAPPPLDDRDLAAARVTVVQALSPTPTRIDTILRATGLAPALVLTVLLELDLAGRLQRLPGQMVALI